MSQGLWSPSMITVNSLDDRLKALEEEPKIMMYNSEGRYIGTKKYEYINNEGYKLSEENKEDIIIKSIINYIYLGNNEKLYKVEKIHSDLYVLQELHKDEYTQYLQYII
jgi:hypothetical protein